VLAQHGNAVAALEVWVCRREGPAVRECRRQRVGELLVVGAGLLQAHHVGRGFLQPRQQAEILG
jgi:hypothetical protein